MRMLVVLRIVLFRTTTRTTKRFPMNPMTMTKVKRMGTTMGTIVIRNLRCSASCSSVELISTTATGKLIVRLFSKSSIFPFSVSDQLFMTGNIFCALFSAQQPADLLPITCKV